MTITERAAAVLRAEGAALMQLAERAGDEYEAAVRLILAAQGKVIVSGIGKSGHIGRKIAASLASTGTPAFFIHPAEALHGDSGMVESDDIVIGISNTGETAELLAFLHVVHKTGAPIIAVTGGPASSLARLAEVRLDIAVEREADPHNLAPTTSAVATLGVGDALAVCLMVERGFTPADFRRFHPGGALGRRLDAEPA